MLGQLKVDIPVVVAGCLVQFKSVIQNSLYIFSAIVFPFLNMGLLVAFFRYGGRSDAILYAIVGSGIMGIWLATTFVTGQIVTFERSSGTLELLVAMPAALQLWIIGRALATTLLALMSLAVTLIGSRVIFGIAFTIRQPFLFLLMLAAITVAFTLLGTMIAGLFVLTRRAGPVANAILYPAYILSGVVFPLSVLPAWLRPLALIIPLHWAADGVRSAIIGDTHHAVQSLLALGVLSTIFAGGCFWCFRFIERRVRLVATLAFD